ncbi:manganese/iron transport system permease protein [Parafrankia irregularis]|uniref:Manganese/iron transport system permease protein n=1 Tax=Parafrankia irregularis TaxID=795642 RepID=A0A0S4QNP1_9ACTN|nr:MULTISPECIES: metal ABC transporter permease [Parafrankia]MBE3204261.1 metal ABC transporter permease [Parafrankia sp. CH37]CUU57232.1 manganese/iron transport system permease protein [Parafrankia irregularis]
MALLESLGDDYIRRALAEVVIVGVLCGAVGVHVVLRRLSFLTMALTHATFPGVVLASLIGMNLVLGAGLFGVLVVLAVVMVVGAAGGAVGTGATGGGTGTGGGAAADRGGSGGGRDISTVTGVVLSAGFALGVALMSAEDGSNRDLSAFLVGSVLTVQTSDLAVSAVTALAVLTVLVALRKELVLAAFDPTALSAAGYPQRTLGLVLLLLVEAAVVTSLPAVGTIMAVALIVGPASTARLWCSSTSTMTVVSIAVAIFCGVTGLAVSEQWDVAAGGAIVLTVVAVLVASVPLSAALTGRTGRSGRTDRSGRRGHPREVNELAREVAV